MLKKTGHRFKTRGLSRFNFCQQGDTNRFWELNFHLSLLQKTWMWHILPRFIQTSWLPMAHGSQLCHKLFTISPSGPSWLQKSFSNRGLEYLRGFGCFGVLKTPLFKQKICLFWKGNVFLQRKNTWWIRFWGTVSSIWNLLAKNSLIEHRHELKIYIL